MRHLTACLIACCAMVAAEAPADAINRIVDLYEGKQGSIFTPVRISIDRYLNKHRSDQLALLRSALGKADGYDELFLAYHLLRQQPRDAAARKAFETAGKPIPFDEQGQRAPDASVPVPNDSGLIALTTGLGYPPLAEVRTWLASNLKTWAGKDRDLRAATLAALLKLDQDGHSELVRPVLAIYFPYSPKVREIYPPAAAAERAWLGPLDRYLLNNGLAGVDAATYPPNAGRAPQKSGTDLTIGGTASWNFPIPVRNVRLELAGVRRGTGSLTASNREGQGVELALTADALVLRSGGKDLQSRPLPDRWEQRGLGLELNIQGRQAQVLLDGVPGAVLELPTQFALTRFTVDGRNLTCTGCTCRYVGDAELGAPPAAPPTPPAAPAWKKQRDDELAKKVSFAFQETTLATVVSTIAQLGGVSILLDASARDLGELPVNLVGKDMPLQEVFTWLKRTADVDVRPSEQGFVLHWGS